MPYFVYLLKCRTNTYYCGYTSDLKKRVETHNAGKGAKYTKVRRPVFLVYSEQFETRSEAMKREIQIKRLSRAEKIAIIENYVSKSPKATLLNPFM